MHAAFSYKLIDIILKIFQVLAAIALMSMMIVVVANIFGRIFFKAPIMGTIELAGLSGVIMVAVAVGFAEHQRRNIFVDIVIERFPPRLRLMANAFNFLLSLGAVGILLWAVTESALESLAQKEITFILDISISPFRFAWATGLLILVVFLLQHLLETLKKRLDK